MANWCEGNIRFRGTKENIKKFLENEIIFVTYEGEQLKPEIEEDEYTLSIYQPNGMTVDSFWFNNTQRNFIFSNYIEVCWPDAEEDEEIVVILNDFNSAWGLRSDGWVEHAKKYNIDVRMFGFEQGMEFSQKMTITRDGDVIDEPKRYDDWNWDCPFPNMGG